MKIEDQINPIQKNGKRKIFMIIGVIALILLTVGLTYAYYAATVTGTGSEINVSTGKLDIDFTDSADVNLTLQAPINDSDRSAQAYKNTFVVKNKTTSNFDSHYNVYLNIISIDPELKNNYMKYELIKDGEVVGNGDFTNANVGEKGLKLNNGLLGTLIGNSQNLELRVWMSYDANNVQNTNMLGKSLNAKVRVESYDVQK